MAHEVNVRNEEELIAFAQALNGLSNAMVQNFNRHIRNRHQNFF